MKWTNHRVGFTVVALLFGSTACGASDAQGGTGQASGSGASSASSGGGNSSCQETVSPIGTSEMTPLGFSAAEVLAIVGNAQSTEIAWLQTPDLYATHERAGSRTPATLSFGKDSAIARFVDSKGGGCPAWGDGPCIVCEPWLEIDLRLDLSTAEGSLAESLDVTLVTARKESARFAATLAGADVKGPYFTQITPKPGLELTSVYIEGAFGDSFPGSRATVPDVWNGFVAARTRQAGSSVDGALVAHGYFPPETAGISP